MLKNEPKWLESDDKGSGKQGQDEAIHGTGEASNSVDVDGDMRSPGSHIGKRPQGRDAAKEARKQSNSSSGSGSSSEYVSRLNEIQIEKLEYMKVAAEEKKSRLGKLAEIEEQKASEQTAHQKAMLEVERQRIQ